MTAGVREYGFQTNWDERDLARLRALWAEGLSASEIGRRMNRSKNAVIGRAHRMGLPSRPSPLNLSAGPRKPRPPKRAGAVTLPPIGVVMAQPASASSRPAECAGASVIQAAPVAFIAPAPPPAAPLFQHHACCFPMWGHHERPTHRYCGAAVLVTLNAVGERVPGPYCGKHHAVAFQPRPVARRPGVWG